MEKAMFVHMGKGASQLEEHISSIISTILDFLLAKHLALLFPTRVLLVEIALQKLEDHVEFL